MPGTQVPGGTVKSPESVLENSVEPKITDPVFAVMRCATQVEAAPAVEDGHRMVPFSMESVPGEVAGEP
jgi:hypothetical protein